ncbi:hypothetical protein AQUCO_10200014v1 [Aquilegia coerulea]|uniref:Leucine-rich repeat-containing N-terminal plant-type domain-containing protein n=1 Tax=Aquilegia coerulea TaxID=218851 RepID=A0A2G5C3U2_AQUCA|nr:hypothetical protein AQUCO_10200014v1 [Aquilegia coerulea]
MCSSCSFSHSLKLFLLLLSLPSFFSLPINAHDKKPHLNKTLQPNNMDPFELETLFKIMETVSSDRNWRLTNPTPCKPGSQWPGIECKQGVDNHVHVSRLDFGSNHFPSCKNTATFPSQIFNLPYLQSVFFYHCFTHTKTSLSIPPRISSASSLQQLSLRSNQALTGPIPPQISLLNSLQILTLSQNNLNGKIPDQLFTLTSLIHLDLSYNFLTGTIPNQVGMLRNLVGLDMSYNTLMGSIPPTIGQLGILQKLDLSSNLLTGSIPPTIEKLNLLVFIALSNNKLGGKFPKGLAKLNSLQYFLMDDNPMFIPLPFEFGRLLKLQELRLANSGYTGTIPQSFTQLKNLSTLSLQNNKLVGEIPVGLSGLSHIYHLNLSRNMLSGVVPFNSGFFNRLGRNLDLTGNPGLCLNGSEPLDSLKIGVGVCGKNNSPYMNKPLKKSQASPSHGFCLLFNLFNILGVWVIYLI